RLREPIALTWFSSPTSRDLPRKTPPPPRPRIRSSSSCIRPSRKHWTRSFSAHWHRSQTVEQKSTVSESDKPLRGAPWPCEATTARMHSQFLTYLVTNQVITSPHRPISPHNLNSPIGPSLPRLLCQVPSSFVPSLLPPWKASGTPTTSTKSNRWELSTAPRPRRRRC